MNESKQPISGNFTDVGEEREDISSSKGACDVKLNEQMGIRPRQPRDTRRIQNFLLVWLDSQINVVNDSDGCRIITELQQVVNIVDTFTDVDECIDFITDVQEEKIFLILSETFIETIVPVADEIPQVSSIYVFPGDKTEHEEWIKQWPQIKDVFADITSMNEELRKVTQEYDHNSVSIGFVPSDYKSKNLDQLDPSFMYTQILKEILLTIDFEQQHINEFLTFCRAEFVGNTIELKNVDKLEREYRDQTPIWWYTYQCFLYPMVNRALRTMEMDIIIKIGFFIQDLHRHITHLHSERYSSCNQSLPFIVYCAQGLPHTDFEQLRKTRGGLLSFNNFLSTTLDRGIALVFAKIYQDNLPVIGILFEITINPSIASTPFANIRNIGYYQEEEEILFSMHSVFRIGGIQQIDGNARLWQVELILTSDTDPQLHALSEFMRKESFPHQKGWYRLGSLMITLAQFNKAEEVFENILRQTCDESEKANIYHMLGIIKYNDGRYTEAITFYEKTIEIMQTIFPSTPSDLTACYRNLGAVYNKIGDYSRALSYHEKAIELDQTTVHSNYDAFSASGDDNNSMNETTVDYSKAILSFEKALTTLQRTSFANDISSATIYELCGSVYEKMDDNAKAIYFYELALKIKIKTNHLPSNHPSLAVSYANLGAIYKKMGDSSTASLFYQLALDVGQLSLPTDHPHLQGYRENVENERQEHLPSNHPSLATSYANLSAIYKKMGDSSTASLFYQLALDVR